MAGKIDLKLFMEFRDAELEKLDELRKLFKAQKEKVERLNEILEMNNLTLKQAEEACIAETEPQ